MALTAGTGLLGRSPAGDFNVAYEARHPFDVAGEARTDDVLGVAHQVATRCSASVSVPATDAAHRRPLNSAATHADHGPPPSPSKMLPACSNTSLSEGDGDDEAVRLGESLPA